VVFKHLQAQVPFTLVGKFVAYEIGITAEAFKSLQRSNDLPDIHDAAVNQIAAFRAAMPNIFYKLYPVPDRMRGEEDWLQNLPGGIMSRPYDPLAVLAAAVPRMFNFDCKGKHRLVGNTKQQSPGLVSRCETQTLLTLRMGISANKMETCHAGVKKQESSKLASKNKNRFSPLVSWLLEGANRASTKPPLQLVLLVLRLSNFRLQLVLQLKQVLLRKLPILPRQQKMAVYLEILLGVQAYRTPGAAEKADRKIKKKTVTSTQKDVSNFLSRLKLLCASSSSVAMHFKNTRRHVKTTHFWGDDELNQARKGKKRSRVWLDENVRISQSRLWADQRAFYLTMGIDAWEDNFVPHQISSNSFVAKAYVDMMLSFVAKSHSQANEASNTTSKSENDNADAAHVESTMYILELGGGHGKLTYLLAKEFRRQMIEGRADGTQRPLLKVCVVFTDMNESIVESRARLPAFTSLLAEGYVDFAHLDLEQFRPPSRKVCDQKSPFVLKLLGSQTTLDLAKLRCGDMLGVVANYLVDSVPCDFFVSTGSVKATKAACASTGGNGSAVDTSNSNSLNQSLHQVRMSCRQMPALSARFKATCGKEATVGEAATAATGMARDLRVAAVAAAVANPISGNCSSVVTTCDLLPDWPATPFYQEPYLEASLHGLLRGSDCECMKTHFPSSSPLPNRRMTIVHSM
jgi:hypothetical protein